jgi:hypothetical protein
MPAAPTFPDSGCPDGLSNTTTCNSELIPEYNMTFCPSVLLSHRPCRQLTARQGQYHQHRRAGQPVRVGLDFHTTLGPLRGRDRGYRRRRCRSACSGARRRYLLLATPSQTGGLTRRHARAARPAVRADAGTGPTARGEGRAPSVRRRRVRAAVRGALPESRRPAPAGRRCGEHCASKLPRSTKVIHVLFPRVLRCIQRSFS